MIEKKLRNILRLSKLYKSELFVVGGTLRDCLLNRKYSDFDFSTRDACSLAKQYAYDTKSALIPLDTTSRRRTFRVVIKNNVYFDFSELQGGSILSDLNKRDFTINAMAVSLQNFIRGSRKYIDPHNGKDDIKKKIIRVLPGPILSNDPLRMLRAFRFMSVMGFQIESGTLKKIMKLNSKVTLASPERIWNELNLLLSSKKASPSIQAMHETGLLKSIFPDLYKSQEMPCFLRILANLENLISNPKQTRFKPLRAIKKVFLKKPELVRLGSILYPLAKASYTKKTERYRKQNRRTKVGSVLSGLHASNADIDFIGAITSCSRSASSSKLNFAGSHPSQPELYQFIYQNEKGLVPGLFIYLSNRLNLPKDSEWETDKIAIAVRNIFDFYFHIYLPAKTKEPLLDGNDIQEKFRITPSPTFTTILYNVEEARILGIINTRSEAISYAKKIIDSEKIKNI